LLKFFTKFRNINVAQRDFLEICRFCRPFQDALAVKIWMDLLEGLQSDGGFKFRVTGLPKCSAPSSGETINRVLKSF